MDATIPERGSLPCAWVEQTGVPRRTFLSTTAEVERDTDLREKDKEVEEKEEEEEEEKDAEEEETKRAEEEKGEAPMARTEEEEETMADPIAKTSPTTTTKQTPKRMQPTDWSWDKDKLQ